MHLSILQICIDYLHAKQYTQLSMLPSKFINQIIRVRENPKSSEFIDLLVSHKNKSCNVTG